MYRHWVLSIPGAARCQVRVSTQGTELFAMTVGQGVSAVSSDVVHDTYWFGLVGNELVALPFTHERLLWPAGVL